MKPPEYSRFTQHNPLMQTVASSSGELSHCKRTKNDRLIRILAKTPRSFSRVLSSRKSDTSKQENTIVLDVRVA
jgi:hypothetical protein